MLISGTPAKLRNFNDMTEQRMRTRSSLTEKTTNVQYLRYSRSYISELNCIVSVKVVYFYAENGFSE